VLEAYRRVGAPLNEFEVRAFLLMNRGALAWRRVERKDNVDTVIGYDFELGEGGSLRARQQGDWFVLYHTKLDAALIEQKRRWDADESVRKETERRAQAESAPASVEGF
jgi:hypothetical protein